MTSFVLDASVPLTWCFPDEEPRRSEGIEKRIANGQGILVPAFWRHEILNALLAGERRKRITRTLTQSFLDELDLLPVSVDRPGTSSDVFQKTQLLCRRYSLTAYDAAYLELAIRENIAMATFDKDLYRAASDSGVMVL